MARSIIPNMSNYLLAVTPIFAVASVPIVKVIIILAVIGLLLWAIMTYVPMPSVIKNIILAFAVIAIVLWLLQIFGLMNL